MKTKIDLQTREIQTREIQEMFDSLQEIVIKEKEKIPTVTGSMKKIKA